MTLERFDDILASGRKSFFDNTQIISSPLGKRGVEDIRELESSGGKSGTVQQQSSAELHVQRQGPDQAQTADH